MLDGYPRRINVSQLSCRLNRTEEYPPDARSKAYNIQYVHSNTRTYLLISLSVVVFLVVGLQNNFSYVGN